MAAGGQGYLRFRAKRFDDDDLSGQAGTLFGDGHIFGPYPVDRLGIRGPGERLRQRQDYIRAQPEGWEPEVLPYLYILVIRIDRSAFVPMSTDI